MGKVPLEFCLLYLTYCEYPVLGIRVLLFEPLLGVNGNRRPFCWASFKSSRNPSALARIAELQPDRIGGHLLGENSCPPRVTRSFSREKESCYQLSSVVYFCLGTLPQERVRAGTTGGPR